MAKNCSEFDRNLLLFTKLVFLKINEDLWPKVRRKIGTILEQKDFFFCQ